MASSASGGPFGRGVTGRRVGQAVLALLVCAAAVAGARLANPDPVHADTASYAYQVLLRTGRPARAAASEVTAWHCPRQHDTSVRRCVAGATLADSDPRYESIFAGRPLWIWSAVPFVLAGGLGGLYAVTAVWAFLLAIACYATARDLGAGLAGGLVAVAVLFASPAGRLATTLLPEGAVLAAVLVAAAGARRTLLGLRHGPALAASGLGAAYLLKSSNGAAVTAAFVTVAGLVAAVALVRRPAGRARRETLRRSGVLAAVAAAAAAGWYAVAAVAGYAGMGTSFEDLRTWHFHRRPTQSVWTVLRRRNVETLGWWGRLFVPPVLPLLLVACVVLLAVVVRSRRTAALWAAVALTGVPLCVLHPVDTNYARLLVPFWLLPAVTAGCLTAAALARRRALAAAVPRAS